MSKNATVPCDAADCRKPVVRYADFEGKGTLELRCYYCGKLNKIIVTQELRVTAKIIKITLAVFIFTILIFNAYQLVSIKNTQIDLAQVLEK